MNFSCIFYDRTHSRILGSLTEANSTRLHWHQEEAKGQLEVQGLPAGSLPVGTPCDISLHVDGAEQWAKGRLVSQVPVEKALQERVMVDLLSEALSTSAEPDETGEPVDLTSVTFDVTSSEKKEPPPGPLRLILQAEWLQQANGVLDLGPCLAAAFPKGKINSLNPRLQMFPTVPGRSGYTSMPPMFERITPPSTGCLGLYPTAMPPLTCGDETVVLPRYWFQATWSLYWSYEQKRSEKLTVTCQLGPEGGDPVEITLKVRDVAALPGFSSQRATLAAHEEEPHDSGIQEKKGETSLWTTIVKEALAQLQSELVERFATVTALKVPLHEGIKLALGQSVCIQLGKDTMKGEIFAKDLYADGPRQEAVLHLRSLPPWLQSWKPQNFSLGPLRHKSPLEGLTEKEAKSAEGWVDIDVENAADEQWAKILEAKPPSKRAAEAWLRQNPTNIRIRLKSLRATRCLLHELEGECKDHHGRSACPNSEKESK